jgi:hypothetical protein
MVLALRPDQLSWNSDLMRFHTMNSSPLVAR